MGPGFFPQCFALKPVGLRYLWQRLILLYLLSVWSAPDLGVVCHLWTSGPHDDSGGSRGCPFPGLLSEQLARHVRERVTAGPLHAMRIAGSGSLPAASCDAECVSLTRKRSGKTLLQGWFSLEPENFSPSSA